MSLSFFFACFKQHDHSWFVGCPNYRVPYVGRLIRKGPGQLRCQTVSFNYR